MTLQQESSPDDKFAIIVINVTNAQPGANVSVTVGPDGRDAPTPAWSSGRDFDNTAGLELAANGDVLPLQSFNVTPAELTFATASGGGSSGPLAFTCQIWVVGPKAIESFVLSATHDRGTLVTGTLSGQRARTIETKTAFTPSSWS